MMDDSSAETAMAAAIAAAAELAKNGGIVFHDGVEDMVPCPPPVTRVADARTTTTTTTTPSAVSSFSPICVEEKTSSNDASKTSFSSDEDDDRDDDDDDDEDEGEEDAEKRLARSRERNREHARRTRLRKKAQLEALQHKAKGLQQESEILKESVEDCRLASILVGISSGDKGNCSVAVDTLLNVGKEVLPTTAKMALVGGKRKRFISSDDMELTPQPLKLRIDGQVTLIGGGGTHINWKTGVYCGENGEQRKLTQDQLESLRRERNRMHAKMTRDRKKNFISSIEKTIEQLESNNQKMRNALLQVAKHHSVVTPISSPLVTSTTTTNQQHAIPHGFSLTVPQ